jgi:hypothetical protein
MKRTTILISIIAATLAPITFYIAQFQGGLTTEHARWGEFGSYFSGVYGSLALIVLTYTTFQTQNQFKRQNEDSVFYKLFDSLQARIQNNTILANGAEYSAHRSLKYIADRFRIELEHEAVDIARNLYCKSPESISDTQYSKLFEAIKGRQWIETIEEDRDAFVADISGQANFNDRWDQLKNYIDSRGQETAGVRNALRATGSVYFYKIPFEERQQHYAAALRRIMDDHGDFLDGYFQTLLFIGEIASLSGNRRQYAQYIISQLTRYEVVIVFYMISGREEHKPKANYLHSLNVFDRLATIDCQSLMIDLPSKSEIESELAALFAAAA